MSFISDNGSGRIAPQRLNSRGPRTLSWPGPTEGPGVRLIWWQGRGKQPAAWLLQVGQLERVRAFERACVRPPPLLSTHLVYITRRCNDVDFGMDADLQFVFFFSFFALMIFFGHQSERLRCSVRSFASTIIQRPYLLIKSLHIQWPCNPAFLREEK